MTTRQEGSRFQVELRGLKLPDEAEERIAFEIRRVVMRQLAVIDFEGDLRVVPGLRLDRTWWGIWIDFRGKIKSIGEEIIR